jgi:hypothetical protein
MWLHDLELGSKTIVARAWRAAGASINMREQNLQKQRS